MDYFEIANKHIERIRQEKKRQKEELRAKAERDRVEQEKADLTEEKNFVIKQERGYYAVYLNGKFYSSGDTYSEAEREAV